MSPILVDSNILIDIFTADPRWYDWSKDRLTELSINHDLYINPIIYSEVSIGFSRIEDFETNLSLLPLEYEEIPHTALFLAGKAFLSYKKRQGMKFTTLPDFFIGAHGAVRQWPVITRDPGRMAFSYPGLELITP